MTDGSKPWKPDNTRSGAPSREPAPADYKNPAVELAIPVTFSPATQQLLAHAVALQPPERRPALVTHDDPEADDAPARLKSVSFKMRRNASDEWIHIPNANETGWTGEAAGHQDTPADTEPDAPPKPPRSGLCDALALALEIEGRKPEDSRTVELRTNLITLPDDSGLGRRFADEVVTLMDRNRPPTTAEASKLMLDAYHEEPTGDYARNLAAEAAENAFIETARSIASALLDETDGSSTRTADADRRDPKALLPKIDEALARIETMKAVLATASEQDFSKDTPAPEEINELCEQADALTKGVTELTDGLPYKTDDVPAFPPVRVILKAGTVEDVAIPHQLVGRLVVEVEDEDVDGVDDAKITTDDDGRRYQVSVFSTL